MAVGWIAADKNSHEVVTKTVSTVQAADYWVDNMVQCATKSFSMDTNTNGIARAK